MANVKNVAPGVGLCAAIAIPCWFLGEALPVVGGPVFAILIGMVIALWWKQPARGTVQDGIAFTAKKVLQYAVILLGFGLNLAQIAAVGAESLPIILTTIATALIVGYILYRVLSVDSAIATLIAVGSSICGGSAIAATAPVIRAKDEQVAQAISVIFLFNVVAALIFPTLGGMLGMSNEGFGLFAGTAVNDTSSVTAAAAAWDGMHPGSNALDDATIVKLTRTLAIIPITLALGIVMARKESADESASNAQAASEPSSTRRKAPARQLLSEARLPDVHPVLPRGQPHHHHRRGRRRRRGGVRAAEDPKQVLHRHGHGCHRAEHRPREAREVRRQAPPHGPHLLDLHRRCQPRHATYAGTVVIVRPKKTNR